MAEHRQIELVIPSNGKVQAFDPRTGVKQLGDSPGDATNRLIKLLRESGNL